MKCEDNCGLCCGVVPVTQKEFDRVASYIKDRGIPVLVGGLTCPFFQHGRCAIYDVRPLACKAFGHVPGMTCPKGHNTPMDERVLK